jgi:hypothetical protein
MYNIPFSDLKMKCMHMNGDITNYYHYDRTNEIIHMFTETNCRPIFPLSLQGQRFFGRKIQKSKKHFSPKWLNG